jgi:hypothetical protein
LATFDKGPRMSRAFRFGVRPGQPCNFAFGIEMLAFPA